MRFPNRIKEGASDNSFGKLVMNELRRANGGVMPRNTTTAAVKAALKNLNRTTDDQTVQIASAAVQRLGVVVSGVDTSSMGEAKARHVRTADYLIAAADRGIPVSEALKVQGRDARPRRPFARKPVKEDIFSSPGDLAPVEDVTFAADDLDAPVFADEPAEDEQWLDAPLDPDLDAYDLDMDDAYMGDLYAEAVLEGDGSSDAHAVAVKMAKKAGKKEGDKDWDATVKKFEKFHGNVGKKKESIMRESPIPAGAYEILVTYISKDVSEDDFEQGASTHSTGIFDEQVNRRFVSAKEMFAFLSSRYDLDMPPKSWLAIDDGVLTTSRMENDDGQEIKDGDREYEAWKSGQGKAWLADYRVGIEFIKTYDPTVAELVKVLGVENY